GAKGQEGALARCQKAVAAPVLSPAKSQAPAEFTEFYPDQLPPLRADAPTLIAGRMKPAKTLTYQLEGTVPGKVDPVSLKVEEKVHEELDNYFLINMARQWKNAKNQPALLRGDRALGIAYEQTRIKHENKLEEGWMAIDKKNFDAALRLFEEARQIKPHDKGADTGIKVVSRLRDGSLTLEALKKQLEDASKNAGHRMEIRDGKPVKVTPQ